MSQPANKLTNIAPFFSEEVQQALSLEVVQQLTASIKELYQDAFIYQNSKNANWNEEERLLITDLHNTLLAIISVLVHDCSFSANKGKTGINIATTIANADKIHELINELDINACAKLMERMLINTIYDKHAATGGTPSKQHYDNIVSHYHILKGILTSYTNNIELHSSAA